MLTRRRWCTERRGPTTRSSTCAADGEAGRRDGEVEAACRAGHGRCSEQWGGLLLCWLVLMAVLWLTRPDELRARELLRLLPDVLRLVSRLSGDRTLPLVDVWFRWPVSPERPRGDDGKEPQRGGTR
jgi:hypothetical protein